MRTQRWESLSAAVAVLLLHIGGPVIRAGCSPADQVPIPNPYARGKPQTEN